MSRELNIKIRPPRPRACKVCATFHKPGQPHDRDSLYYQNHFYRDYGRFPTWEDAMAHCTEDVKAAFRAKLEGGGG